jgi:ABC-type uncharacterized transport system involved in gliding motility auxiliary subunit
MKSALKFLLKYLIFVGVGLISAGLMAGFISGNWDTIATGLIIAGTVLMGVWLLFLGRFGDPNQPNFWQRRSTQVGTNALVSTLSVLTIIGLLNFVAVRNAQKFDLTETQLFSLAPESVDVLKRLGEPVNLYLFTRDRDASDQALLENFRAQSKNFNYEFVDPQTSPDLAKRLEPKNDPVNKDVYVERFSKDQNRPISQFVQVINPNQRLSESRLVNALIRLTSNRQPKIYFLTGHGEKPIEPGQQSITQAVKGLKDRNFVTEPLNLAQTAQVPTDAAVIVIAAPKQQLLEPEVKLLEEYQAKGGNILVLLEPQTQTGLEPLLQQWGVVLDDRLAIDASGIGEKLKLGPASPIVDRYSDHPITRNFANSISFYPFARPLEIKEVPGVRPNPIVLTNDRSWAEANPEEKPVKFSEGDRMGPLPIAVALSRITVTNPSPSTSPTVSPTASPIASPTASPTATPTVSPTASPTPALTASPEARMVVFGSAGFALDGYFNQAINGDVFINSVSWLTQDDSQTLSVRPRDMRNRRITPTQPLILTMFLGPVVILPLIGVILATVLWWLRR